MITFKVITSSNMIVQLIELSMPRPQIALTSGHTLSHNSALFIEPSLTGKQHVF